MDSWKMKAASFAAKGYLSRWQDKSQTSRYVKIFLFGACGILVLLGLIGLLGPSISVALISVLIGLLVASSELGEFIAPIYKIFFFFYESYLYRAVAYSLLSLPTFFSLYTFFGGLLIIGGSLGYGFCAFRGEKPPDPSTVSEEPEAMPYA
eukprot:TRINITY_DN1244_c0_g1_i1.p1 TRINITY_DN1244_c0_g1~~TRINITY_DN1244_c0_g1_i1.p1  ORF type:complete len:162 (-),score=45.38 TRINITY_DN1244_c0_g1_i1:4-456(-)